MKGVELPISTLVIVVLALIILLGILALFFGVWTPGSTGISLEAAKNNACQMLLSTGCGSPGTIAINGFDANKDGTQSAGTENSYPATCSGGNDNLARLCRCWYGADESDCRTQICNCP